MYDHVGVLNFIFLSSQQYMHSILNDSASCYYAKTLEMTNLGKETFPLAHSFEGSCLGLAHVGSILTHRHISGPNDASQQGRLPSS